MIMDTNKMNTDELFYKLPAMVTYEGEFYFFYLMKGQNRINVGYRTNKGKHLRDTGRSGDDLKGALKSMLDWLMDFDHYNKPSENVLLDMINNR
jgi:hypothetical protein